MKIYLAGGMKSGWQQRVKEAAPEFQYLDPCTHGLEEETQYTLWDLQAIRAVNMLFVYFEADNPSGFGLSLEIGYAAALGKSIVLVDEITTANPNTGKYLGMMRSCCQVVVQSFDEGLSFLKSLAKIQKQ